MSNLYIVATPIGNLEDVTFRAVRLLGEVDLILAEDSRVTRKLLNYLNIRTKILSFHEHSPESVYQNIFKMLAEGKNLALVTDAGTPAVSDPGGKLVRRIRQELPEVKIHSVPGPSSLTAAISVAGLAGSGFYFAGFSPHKKGRQTFFREMFRNLSEGAAFIFFESPHRILKALNSLAEFEPKREVIIVREVTKIFEEVLIGSASELAEKLKSSPEKIRGEFVVIVH
ncbi:MAG TPA: 16S rRNA (cytidine(1402)-2'-O)-methyltransferase [Candidatus Paceibacterota bacterium]|nr:16S rRNA (cytidine(1402)-2'-O)-methyltransferase [Candidatus Paceibacterota bacterium]HRZ34709.1 16S rRNA (cytidine(1402)-2'-O)-methyltransferase [Candidatus Paceibacterota bacterium]